MKIIQKLLFFGVLISAEALFSAPLNLVIFSKNRAHQIHNFLESFHLNTTGCSKISVIYKADTKKHEKAYKMVKKAFPEVQLIKESEPSDFKELTLKAIDFNSDDYIAFAVDDIIVTRKIDFDEIVTLLESFESNGFYLRLGEHITECYSENRVTGTPPFQEIVPGVLCWNFKDGSGDWNYPHTVDMTVYKKKDLKKVFLALPFSNPNILEGIWASVPPKQGKGLCYRHAPIVNCPLNRVQTTWSNRHSNTCSAEELLEMFLAGYKMDITPLQNIFNKAPHMDYKPTFISK